jgi:hypothetical protein
MAACGRKIAGAPLDRRWRLVANQQTRTLTQQLQRIEGHPKTFCNPTMTHVSNQTSV